MATAMTLGIMAMDQFAEMLNYPFKVIIVVLVGFVMKLFSDVCHQQRMNPGAFHGPV